MHSWIRSINGQGADCPVVAEFKARDGPTEERPSFVPGFTSEPVAYASVCWLCCCDGLLGLFYTTSNYTSSLYLDFLMNFVTNEFVTFVGRAGDYEFVVIFAPVALTLAFSFSPRTQNFVRRSNPPFVFVLPTMNSSEISR
jgi:hypothetical protein